MADEPERAGLSLWRTILLLGGSRRFRPGAELNGSTVRVYGPNFSVVEILQQGLQIDSGDFASPDNFCMVDVGRVVYPLSMHVVRRGIANNNELFSGYGLQLLRDPCPRDHLGIAPCDPCDAPMCVEHGLRDVSGDERYAGDHDRSRHADTDPSSVVLPASQV